jgi:nucleotide-binding universal stress UspA family protein
MFGRMILGFDGTAQSSDALALARLLASKAGSAIVVSHVVPHPPPFDARTREYVKQVQAHLRSVLEPAVAALSGLVTETHPIESTSPARGLHEIAVEEGASLIVIGSTHRGPVGRVVLGSVGEVLVAGSPTAVAVAPKGFAARAPEEMRVVGAGFNGSPEARLALRAAATLAAGAGAELRAIAVEEGFAHAHHPIRPEYRAESRLVEQLDHALEEVGAPDAKRVVEKGAAVHCLCEASRETDLLVIGSRGYGPMRHALVGSVSAQLMRSAPVPVLVIPRGAGTEDGTGEGIAVGAPTRA